ncbi:MAG: PcfJ domain-containing protein [Bacteroidales bacterium]|nr:PcfJ domain-containing protein [Bacteroidales bacterium]MDD4672202.1 PcfJ domain-containing protein [Bacteroidales bacterium]MDY0349606.1 PcfJ domain-containing protein [Tenuifilaceae bacterium]
MNSLINQSDTIELPALSYGYIRKGEITKWIFWEYDQLKNIRKFSLEINTDFNRLNLIDEIETQRVPLRNTLGFCKALGVDWLTKAMPNPQLFMERIILEEVALRRITNPSDLASYILGADLSAKVSPKLFFRSVLTDQFFDTWDKIKIAILLLMVSDNEQKTIDRIVFLTQRFNANYNFYRLVNLSFKKGVFLDCFMLDKSIEKQISILDKENQYLYKDTCYIEVDGAFSSCGNLVALYSSYALRSVTIAEFKKKQKKSIYYGTLHLPKGMELLETCDELAREGRRMSHCVGTYLPQLLSKKSFFLHVKLEESATVEIVKNTKKKRFVINQINGVANKSVRGVIISSVNSAISTPDAQYFFYRNSYKSRRARAKIQEGPSLFDELLK